MAAHPSARAANTLSGNVSPSSCSYPATLYTASAVILPCIVSALPLGPIREYGHAAAITTGTSAATIPCIQPISTTTGSGGPILRADVHTELAMPDRGLHHTSSLCQRDCSDLAAQPEAVVQAAPIWRHPYQWLLFLAGLSSPEMANRLIGTVFITHPGP
jgi:hypothetical protein